jgi:hypothetical protein
MEEGLVESRSGVPRTGSLRLAAALFASGAGLMIAAVLLGNPLQTEITRAGMDAYLHNHGPRAWLQFFVFALGFPLGAGLCAVAALLGSERSIGRIAGFGAWVTVVAASAIFVPGIAGRAADPLFFASGGYLLLLLILAALWFWGRYRRALEPALRPAADIQAAGYLCFAAASWNLCGLATMPSYALEPERMSALNTLGFATGQAKAIMALLVVAWLLIAWGYREAARVHGSASR